jgi:membrane associated rhomboid family serine protease
MIPLKDNLSCKTFPVVTLVLIAINAVAFGIELMLPPDAVGAFFQTWAVVPSKVTHAFTSGDPALIAMSLLSVLTAMFLHGGWSHIIGNMIFLQAFGRAVEGRLGWWRYIGVYLLGGFAAWGLHMFVDPMSSIPALGASGAIAGVLGAYLVFYPKAEFKTLFIVGFLPLLAVIRAYWLLAAWFIMQMVPAIAELAQPSVGGGVAYWAHIGGFLFGMIAAGWYAWRKPVSSVCYTPLTCDCTCAGGCTKKHGHRFLRSKLQSGQKPCGRGGSDHHHHD